MKVDDALKAIERWANGDVAKEFISAEKMNFATLAQQTEFIQSVVPPSGGSSVITTNNITVASSFPVNSASVVLGSNAILFSIPLASASWVLVAAYMISSTGTTIDLIDQVSSRTALGFLVNAPEAGTFFYAVMPSGYTAGSLACTTSGNPNLVTFTNPFSSSDWVLISCYAISSTFTILDLRDQISSKTTTGFRVTVPEDCTVYYSASPKT